MLFTELEFTWKKAGWEKVGKGTEVGGDLEGGVTGVENVKEEDYQGEDRSGEAWGIIRRDGRNVAGGWGI